MGRDREERRSAPASQPGEIIQSAERGYILRRYVQQNYVRPLETDLGGRDQENAHADRIREDFRAVENGVVEGDGENAKAKRARPFKKLMRRIIQSVLRIVERVDMEIDLDPFFVSHAAENYTAIRNPLFWCERGDHFFKTRIAAERVPERQQFQLTIADITWIADDHGELAAGQIRVTGPCRNHGQIFNRGWAKHYILFCSNELYCVPAFTQSLFLSAETCVDQAKHAQRQTVIRSGLNYFFLLDVRRSEGCARFIIIVVHSRDHAFHE